PSIVDNAVKIVTWRPATVNASHTYDNRGSEGHAMTWLSSLVRRRSMNRASSFTFRPLWVRPQHERSTFMRRTHASKVDCRSRPEPRTDIRGAAGRGQAQRGRRSGESGGTRQRNGLAYRWQGPLLRQG